MSAISENKSADGRFFRWDKDSRVRQDILSSKEARQFSNEQITERCDASLCFCRPARSFKWVPTKHSIEVMHEIMQMAKTRRDEVSKHGGIRFTNNGITRTQYEILSEMLNGKTP